MNTKTGKPLRYRNSNTHTRLHTQDELQDMCVCVFVSLMQFKKKKKKKSTSLPRELSAIADLNPLRYVSAASSFWTAVAAVTKQVHFLFSGINQGPQQSALGPFWMHSTQGFYRKRDSMSTQTYLSIMLQNRKGAGLIYTIIANVNDYFLFPLFLVSGVVGRK